MRRLLAFLMLCAAPAVAQPPIFVGGGGSSGSVAPGSFSSPTGTITVGGSSGAVTLDAATSVLLSYVTGTSDPATCTTGSIFNLRTDSTLLKFCTTTNTWTSVVTDNRLTDCQDTGGNHLNYNSSTGAWSCGTSSGGSGVGTFFAGNLGATSISASTTSYINPAGGSPSTEVSRSWMIPAACTARNLYVVTSNAQSGTGAMVVTVRKNGAGTAITLTISAGAGAATFSDTTHTASFAATDLMALEFANAATAGSAAIRQFSVQCN